MFTVNVNQNLHKLQTTLGLKLTVEDKNLEILKLNRVFSKQQRFLL